MPLVCLAMILAGTALAENADPPAEGNITIATGEWAPWTGADLAHKGFVCRVVREVFNRAGYDVTFEFYPWQRAYTRTLFGKADASAYWYESENRKKDCYYSAPLTREEIVFFHLKSSPMAPWDGLTDLEGYRIGISRGNTYTDAFLDLGKQGVLTLDAANSDIANFRKLLAGRIDIFPCAKLRGYTLINHHFSGDDIAEVTHHEKPLTETTGHLLFPRGKEDSRRLKRIFDEQLSQLKSEGVYHKYFETVKRDAYEKK